MRCTGKLSFREDWKQNVSTREALPHEGMICTVAGRKMTGFIGKAVHDKRILMTMEVVSEQIIIMENMFPILISHMLIEVLI